MSKLKLNHVLIKKMTSKCTSVIPKTQLQIPKILRNLFIYSIFEQKNIQFLIHVHLFTPEEWWLHEHVYLFMKNQWISSFSKFIHIHWMHIHCNRMDTIISSPYISFKIWRKKKQSWDRFFSTLFFFWKFFST